MHLTNLDYVPGHKIVEMFGMQWRLATISLADKGIFRTLLDKRKGVGHPLNEEIKAFSQQVDKRANFCLGVNISQSTKVVDGKIIMMVIITGTPVFVVPEDQPAAVSE